VNADASVSLYLRLRDEVIPEVPAMKPGESAVVPKQVTCPSCRKCRVFTWLLSRKSGDRWVCSKCGADWPTQRTVVSVTGGSRKGETALETRMQQLHDLAKPLARLPMWPLRVLVANAQLNRLQATIRNLHRDSRAKKQQLIDLNVALGRSRSWERKIVGACATLLAQEEALGEHRRRAEVLALAFPAAFPRAARVPSTVYAIRENLRIARQGYERAGERAELGG